MELCVRIRAQVAVARPVDGITLNGELEFLLDDIGAVKVFDSETEAKSFLAAAGVDPEELRHMIFRAYEGGIRCEF